MKLHAQPHIFVLRLGKKGRKVAFFNLKVASRSIYVKVYMTKRAFSTVKMDITKWLLCARLGSEKYLHDGAYWAVDCMDYPKVCRIYRETFAFPSPFREGCMSSENRRLMR